MLGVLAIIACDSVGLAVWTTIETSEEKGIRTLNVKSVNDWSILRFPVLPRWNIKVNNSVRIASSEDPAISIEIREVERGVKGPEARDEGRMARWLSSYSGAKPDSIKMGSMMNGAVPVARVSYKRGPGGFRTYAVFVVRGVRFIAILDWSNATAHKRLLTRELSHMFYWIELADEQEVVNAPA